MPIDRHLIGLFLSQAIRVVSALATLPLVAHAVSIPAFGEYSFFLTLAQATSVVVDMGFSVTGYALMRPDEMENADAFASITALRLGVGLVLTAGFAAAAVLIAPDLLAYSVGSGALATGLGCSTLWYLNWRRATFRLVAYEGLPVIVMAGAALLVLLERGQPMAVLFVGAVGALFGPLQLAGPAWVRRLVAGQSILMPAIIATLPAQAVITGARLIVATYTVAIVPLGRGLMDLTAVGHYAACEKLGGVMGVLGVVAAQQIAPALMRSRDDPARLARGLRQLLLIGGALTIAVLVPLVAFAAPIVEVVFGPNFAGLQLGAAMVLLGSGFAFWNAVIWNGIAIPLGRREGFLAVSVLGAAVSVATIWSLAHFGYLALSSAKLGSELAIFMVSLVMLRRLAQDALAGRGLASSTADRESAPFKAL